MGLAQEVDHPAGMNVVHHGVPTLEVQREDQQLPERLLERKLLSASQSMAMAEFGKAKVTIDPDLFDKDEMADRNAAID